MELTAEERLFLQRRGQRVRTWPIAGGILVALTVGLALWMFFTKPMFANPFHVIAEVGGGRVEPALLETMAMFLPMVVTLCMVVLAAMVGFAFVVFRTEKRYRAILSKAGVDLGDGR